MKNVKEFYNETASGWSNEFYEEKVNKEVINKFVGCFIDAGTMAPRILDLGCGVGYDSKTLVEFGAKPVGVDLSEKSIEIAKQNVQNCKFFVGDITDKLTNLGMFEGVVCLDTIMHINIEKMKNTFGNNISITHRITRNS